MIKDLPERLKLYRTKYGYSQKQVAQKLNVSPSIISAYETGERTPSLDILLSFAYLYNCSTDSLLGKVKEKPSMQLDTDGLTGEQIQAIAAVINSIKK